MNRFFSRFKVVTTLAVASSVVLGNVQPAHAILGAVSGDIPLIVIGASLTVGGGALGIYSINSGGTYSDEGGFLGFLAQVAGIILLKDNGQVTPQFAPFSDDSYKDMGISENEAQAYNNEIANINLIDQTIVSDALAMTGKGTMTVADIESFAEDQWNKDSVALSPDAALAVKKLRASLRSKSIEKKQ